MADLSCERKVTIVNELGLHARAATKFVECAGQFSADVFVSVGELEVSGKSIMGILMLVAAKGTEISIRTEGDDAEACAQALCDLVSSSFGE